MDADGVGDDTVRVYRDTWRATSIRECGACVKAVVGVVSGRDAVHLGPDGTGVQDPLRAG